ncbi:MAG: Na+/H+ antiporter NhaC family protein [Planctomycetes bacterium]|nr:Na+/H+ antiporter NhaC family protein [Planctomycetota bacterium]
MHRRLPLFVFLIAIAFPAVSLGFPQKSLGLDQKTDESRQFRIEIPETVERDGLVKYVRITVLKADGKVDSSYNHRVLIQGIRLTVRDPKSKQETETKLEPFREGVLHLTTDEKAGRKVYLTGLNIVVSQPTVHTFRIETPPTVLTDVPVKFVKITALGPDDKIDKSYQGRPLIEGVILTKRDANSGKEVDTALPAFRNGVLTLKTDISKGVKVYVSQPTIVVDPKTNQKTEKEVFRTQRWLSIVPPVIAVVLAIWVRNVLLALFAAVWSGAVILAQGNFFEGFVRTLDTYVVGEIVSANDGYSHILILLFTMFLGAMIGVMARSGGTSAIVRSMARFSKTREQGQMLTWGMGFAIFFDDYANTLLVGGTMRPITDRLKISREKLAFIVDSTAAPIAGLAVISTWVGVEVGFIQDTYKELFRDTGVEWNAYSTFLTSLPYRFYSLHLVVFVLLIAYSGNDFGPMLRAEARALKYGQLTRPGATVDTDDHAETADEKTDRPLLRTAIVPLVVLISLIVVGLWWTGSAALAASNEELAAQGKAEIPATLWSILQHSSSNRVMFLSSFAASISAIAIAVFSRTMKIREAVDAWAAGAKTMFFALVILVLAWAIATQCNSDHLNTAGFLVELAGGRVSASWTPTLAFLLAAAVSFATGSSFTTMGLLMPLFITMTYYLLLGENVVDPNQPLMLATIGAVLAGSIFGDHCSPISDTTVLSSAACRSDHLDHVTTQLPYAVTVALVSLVFGYIPVGFGFSPLILLPVGLIALYCIVQFFGQPVAEYAEKLPESAPATRSSAQDKDDDKPAAASEVDDVDVDWDALPGG